MLVVERLLAPATVGFLLDLAPGEPIFHTVCLHFDNFAWRHHGFAESRH